MKLESDCMDCMDCGTGGGLCVFHGVRRRVLSDWRRLEWRHHGTGMLQAYLPGWPDQRVHVWDRRLLIPGLIQSGAMHNHRFRLLSRVLVGGLTNTNLCCDLSPLGTHQLWRIPGASKGSELVEGPRCLLRTKIEFGEPSCRQLAGQSYVIDKWDYHWARQDDGDPDVTITHVSIFDKSDRPASLVCPYGLRPVHAFAVEAPHDLQTQILTKAHELLQEASSSGR